MCARFVLRDPFDFFGKVERPDVPLQPRQELCRLGGPGDQRAGSDAQQDHGGRAHRQGDADGA